MRRFLVIMVIMLFCCTSFAQVKEMPDDSLITKLKIKTIFKSSFDGTHDSTIESYLEIYHYDTIGRLISHQLIDKDSTNRDTKFDGDYNFYNKNNKLIENWHIGVWNLNTMKQDTTFNKYYYNNENLLEKETSKNRGGNWDQTFHYFYENSYELCIGTNEGIHKFTFSRDSMIYLRNGKLGFSFDTKGGSFSEYKYNDEGQIIMEKECYFPDTMRISSIYRYYYTNGLLLKETELETNPFVMDKNDFFDETSYQYYYDKNKLLNEIRKVDDNVMIERFRYEFYNE
jgi:hypothetical protein